MSEDEWIEALVQELEVLNAIFPGELWISCSVEYPICIRFELHLEGFDCVLQMMFVVNVGYPLDAELKVCSYLPPPFIDRLGKEKAEELQELLVQKAKELFGSPAIYDVVETARNWLEKHAEVFAKKSKSRNLMEKVQGGDRISFRQLSRVYRKQNLEVLTLLSGIEILDFGDVEQIIEKMIDSFLHATIDDSGKVALSRSSARRFLRESAWNLEKSIDNYNAQSKELDPHWSTEISKNLDSSDILRLKEFYAGEFECGACTETHLFHLGAAMRCGHWMCVECWDSLLNIAISEGKFAIQCPGRLNETCSLLISDDLIFALASNSTFIKFQRWIQMSYIRSVSKSLHFCRNPTCNEYLHRYVLDANSQDLDSITVVCKCGFAFCPFCEKENGHWPLSCRNLQQVNPLLETFSTYQKWLKENVGKDENILELQGKECPQCGTFWEKNGGCLHMTCANCKFEWCWKCLRAWGDHAQKYDFYDCQNVKQDVTQKAYFTGTGYQEFDSPMMYLIKLKSHSAAINALSRYFDFESQEVISNGIPEFQPIYISKHMVFMIGGLSLFLHRLAFQILLYLESLELNYPQKSSEVLTNTFSSALSMLDVFMHMMDAVLLENFPLIEKFSRPLYAVNMKPSSDSTVRSTIIGLKNYLRVLSQERVIIRQKCLYLKERTTPAKENES